MIHQELKVQFITWALRSDVCFEFRYAGAQTLDRALIRSSPKNAIKALEWQHELSSSSEHTTDDLPRHTGMQSDQ